MEIHFQRDLDGYRMPIFHRGLKAVFSGDFHGLLVQTHAQRTENADFSGQAIRSHDHSNQASPLIFRLPGFLGKFRFRLVQRYGRANPATHAENAAAGAATFARTEARPFSRSNASTAARANPAA